MIPRPRLIRRLSTEIVAFSAALGYVVDQSSKPDDRRIQAKMTAAKAPRTDRVRPAGPRGFAIGGAAVPAATLDPGLYVVATPIGNLMDVTLRALAILAGADEILAEDTRVSRALLARYGIGRPVSPYHEHNAAEARPRALKRIAEGQALALISDAGTPLISDPGYKLVAEAIAQGFAVTAAPGPSAALAALCVAGLPTDRFTFEGFLPARRSARRERINALAAVPGTLVFYEAPGRVAETLADLALELGPRAAAVARELTKLHEEVRRGALDELAAEYSAGETPRGEIVIVVGPGEARPVVSEAALDREIAGELTSLSVRDAAAAVAARHGLPRRHIYARALKLAGARR
ncbi:MAG TPA: 16S rRNA (cytidine(1402)-2'-O)-methyltransferase [Roseiarcus sp.]|nr:16S rRNA (cytidine(1402)-2'-O)-methyltransferase [Roseiarcus sp.]